MVGQGMAGITPISWLELDAYDRCNGLGLSSWEASTLMQMSRSYCRWRRQGSEQTDIPDEVPYIDESEEAQQVAAESIMRSRDASRKLADDARQ